MRNVEPEQTKGPAGGHRQITASDLAMDAENSHTFIGTFFRSSAFYFAAGIECLDLDLLEAVLPDGGVRGNTVLTEVDENVPRRESASCHVAKESTVTYMASPSMDWPIRTS